MEFVTPRIVISKCITFASCRWNGLTISSEMVDVMKPFVEFIPVCAEVEIGLGVPRKPIRLVRKGDDLRLMQSETEADVTERMDDFARSYARSLEDIDGCILKSRSPSCGMKGVKVYPGMGKVGALRERTAGFFARALMERFSHLGLEDEGRLNNFRIREHFFTRVFAAARLRELREAPSMGALVDFHAQNKLLLMSYSQKELRALGRIVANHERRPLEIVMDDYAEHFLKAFEKQPRFQSNINVLMHALGYFSKGVSRQEKAFFLGQLDKYRDERLPLSAPISIIKSFIIRFDEKYLSKQTYFSPYPEQMMEIKDSGEGRKY